MKRPIQPHVRAAGVLVAGGALELAVAVALRDFGAPYPTVAAALGVLLAVLAGTIGGWWIGLAVAAVGWASHFFLVADESVRAVLALPAWLAAGAAAGWLAARLAEASAERQRLAAELDAVRDSTAEAVVGVDPEGTIVAWGSGAQTVYGYSAEEAQGRPLSFLAGQNGSPDAGPDLVAAARERKRLEAVRVRHERKGGAELVGSVSLTPLPNSSGRPGGAVLVAEDVGEPARVRERLGEAEAKYRSLAAHLPLVTYVYPVGERAGALFVSPQVEAMLGYSAEEWLAQPDLFERLVHEQDRERVLAQVAAEREGQAVRSEYRMLARDGRVVRVRDEGAIVRDSGGEPLYVQGFLLDVSERHRSEEEKEKLRAAERAALAESQTRQRKLDFLGEACSVIASSPDYHVTLRRVAELAVRDLADWCFVDVVDDDGNATRLVAEHAAPGSPPRPGRGAEPEAEVAEVVRSGRATVSENRICAPLLARGRALGALTFLLEQPGRTYGSDDLALVEGLATTAALAVDDARLYGKVEEGADAARVLTYVADAVFLLDRAGVVRLWNPAAEAITGIDGAAVVGQPAAQVIPGWEALFERIPVGEAAEPVPAATLPIETERGERWISISGVDFFGGTVFAFRDLTEARRLEELKADFLATASHELRTPLAAVYGAAQTLRRHDFALDETGRERFISLIVDESERLARIVNEILLANQLELGRVDLANEPFDGVELAERVAEAVRIHAPPGIQLDVEAAEPTVLVVADRDRVRQVLMNLVENAIKYSPDGGRIELGVEPAGSNVRFRVRDEGLGIPADEHARIFDKFYRLDPGMTRGVGGTGLGLYICSELVERMGGSIWVDSREGVGSTFFVEIPAGDTRSQRPLAPAARENGLG